MTKDVLSKVYKVNVVAHGNTPTEPDLDGKDPYEVNKPEFKLVNEIIPFPSFFTPLISFEFTKLPKFLGIYVEIQNPKASVTTDGIISRIIDQRLM